MKPEIRPYLTNRDVIAIDQDPLGRQGIRAYSDGEVEVWTRQLQGGAIAVAIVAAGDSRYSTHPFHLNLAKLGLHGQQPAKTSDRQAITLTDNQPIEIESHDVLLRTHRRATVRASTNAGRSQVRESGTGALSLVID